MEADIITCPIQATFLKDPFPLIQLHHNAAQILSTGVLHVLINTFLRKEVLKNCIFVKKHPDCDLDLCYLQMFTDISMYITCITDANPTLKKVCFQQVCTLSFQHANNRFFISICCAFPYNFHAFRSLNLVCLIVHFALCPQDWLVTTEYFFYTIFFTSAHKRTQT